MIGKRTVVGVSLLLWLCCCQSAFAEPTNAWPAWSAVTANGKLFQSKSLDGKVVVVSVWASSCSSCRRQMPLLSRLQKAHGSDLQVLSFSLDRSEEKHESFLASEEVSFPAIYAREGKGLNAVRLLQNQVGPLEAVPTLLIFDRQGNLVHRSVGFVGLSDLEGLVGPLIGGVAVTR